MKIKCLHGYFIFEETKAGQISDFSSLSGFDLVSEENYYTFNSLAGAPNYAIKGGLYLGATVNTTFEGKPWEILRANSLIYNFDIDEVVPISTVKKIAEISTARNYFISNGMILPGSLTDEGNRVTDYSAFYLFDLVKFKYSEVDFE